MIYYSGVGSRNTPNIVLQTMQNYGTVFAKLGYTLRSGAAAGADTAFEQGADREHGLKEIYLPWQGFNDHTSSYFNVNNEAFKIAADIYGKRWEGLSIGIKLLMARNMYQVLGYDLDTPSKFVLCFTPDGAITADSRTRFTGGTGQAIACASMYNIPVFNLQNVNDEDWLLDFVSELND